MTTKRFADDINQQLTSQARLVAQTRIDLEAFLALPKEVRAAQWRRWDRQSKADVVIQMIVQIWIERWGAEDAGEAWSEALVQHWIDRYDERWGAEPTPEEMATADALEQLIEEANQHQVATSSPVVAAAAVIEARHLSRARAMFQHGLRVRKLETGCWSVPSSKLDGTAYECSTQQCRCPRGGRGCWHRALVRAVATATGAFPSRTFTSACSQSPQPAPSQDQVAPVEPVEQRLARIHSQVWLRAFDQAA